MRTALFTLLPPFYDPPPFNDVTVYLKRIEDEFSIKVEKYKYFNWAFGNDVFLINDEFIFRFPRVEQTVNHLKYEIEFLEFLKPRVKVNIPQYTHISKKEDFAGYEIIPGKHLTSSAFKTLNKKNKEKVINELIAFINVFHKIDLNDFEKYKPAKRDDYISIEKRIEEELEDKLFPKLSKNELELIRDFYEESKKILQEIPNTCPIHGDLYAYNTIWDKVASEIAIIDFSDYMTSDPARDFEVFYDYGQEYAELAYEKYEGLKDSQFLQRAEIYYKAHGIYTLLSSLLGAKISFDVAYKYFFKEKFNL